MKGTYSLKVIKIFSFIEDLYDWVIIIWVTQAVTLIRILPKKIGWKTWTEFLSLLEFYTEIFGSSFAFWCVVLIGEKNPNKWFSNGKIAQKSCNCTKIYELSSRWTEIFNMLKVKDPHTPPSSSFFSQTTHHWLFSRVPGLRTMYRSG